MLLLNLIVVMKMTRIRKKIPNEIPFTRKIDFGTSIKLQRILHPDTEIINVSGEVATSQKLRGGRVGSGKIHRRETDHLQHKDKINVGYTIDDRISIREFMNIFAEKHPDLMDEELAKDVSLRNITEVYDVTSMDELDGIEYIMLQQTKQRARKERGYFYPYRYMKNELTIRDMWDESFYNPLRAYGVLMSTRLWGVSGDNVIGIEGLFPHDYRFIMDSGDERIVGSSDDFMRTTRTKGDFSTDMAFPIMVSNDRKQIESMIMYLESIRHQISVKITE